MANASADFIWGVVRDTSCHIIKHRQSGKSGMGSRGAEFTTEPNNPTGRNAFKYSGLANAKTIDVVPTEGGVVMVTKTKNAARAGKVRDHAAAEPRLAFQRHRRPLSAGLSAFEARLPAWRPAWHPSGVPTSRYACASARPAQSTPP